MRYADSGEKKASKRGKIDEEDKKGALALAIEQKESKRIDIIQTIP